MRILIVDDDALSLRVLRQILLSQPGFEIEEAACGVEAWILLANPANAFDAVFLDISMPDFDGVEVLERMRSTSTLRNVPVIMVSGANDRPTVLKAIEAGAQNYIVKPASASVVIAKLKQALAALPAAGAPLAKSV